jgi:alpha-L-fucosidase 2
MRIGWVIMAFSMMGMCGAFEAAGRADTPGSLSTFQSQERARKHAITATRPSPNFFSGALLGNGGMEVVVTTRPDAVTLIFGHNDVWDIRVGEGTKDSVGTFREVFDRVKAIPDTLKDLYKDPWYKHYTDSMQSNYSKPYPRPFPCGSIVLWFDRREAELIGHRLSVENGLCEVEFLADGKKQILEIFADMESDRLWLRMVDAQGKTIRAPFRELELLPDPDTPKEFPRWVKGGADDWGTISFRQILPSTEYTDSAAYRAHPKDRAFRLGLRVAGRFDKGSRPSVEGFPAEFGPLEKRIEQDSGFVMCVELDRGIASDVATEAALPEPSSEAYRNARNAALGEWARYWSKSGVALADEALERIWYRNLYFLRCSIRSGVTCPGLFANWSYRGIGTAWHGDYHLNYNIQQPFWAAFSTNHPELHLPYVDMVDHILPISKQWAKEYYHLRGAFFPHTSYPVEMHTMPYPLPHWGWEVFETPWAVQTLWWHFLYTRDKAFLKDRAFGPMKEATLFLADYMKRPEARGSAWGDDFYHIFPTVPPELYGLRPGFDKNSDTIADLALTRYLFHAFTEACSILGNEAEEAELLGDIRDILARFPPYPTAKSSRGEVFLSVKGEDPEVVYNVPVSLMTVFPGDHHGLDSPPDEYRTAVNTYRNQQNEGGNELVFLNVQAARLGVLDLERFKRQVEYCTLPDGTCADMVLQIHGRYTNSLGFDYMAPMGIWFENFSLPLVINECMLQSYSGTLRFFPNWPKDAAAEFRSLRAVGAFLVSAKRSRSGVEWVEATCEAGGTLSFHSPWGEGAVCERAGKRERIAGETIRLETKPGEVLRFFAR